MVRVLQVVGVGLFPLSVPGPPAGEVSVLQGDVVVDVDVPGILQVMSLVGCPPPSRLHPALPFVLVFHWFERLGDQHLLPRVLAVPVLVGPVIPLIPVVFGDALGDRGHGDYQGAMGVATGVVAALVGSEAGVGAGVGTVDDGVSVAGSGVGVSVGTAVAVGVGASGSGDVAGSDDAGSILVEAVVWVGSNMGGVLEQATVIAMAIISGTIGGFSFESPAAFDSHSGFGLSRDTQLALRPGLLPHEQGLGLMSSGITSGGEAPVT